LQRQFPYWAPRQANNGLMNYSDRLSMVSGKLIDDLSDLFRQISD
jgi:hypothetical protein